jgi:two-component system, cell cycle response regulator CpdR
MAALSILYVEDNDTLRETVTELLEGDGRDIVAVASAEQALACCQQREFDLLITDISLPGMPGTDLARQMLAARPEQWVVFCSGYAHPQGLAKLGKNVRTIDKAFEIDEMDALLEQISVSLQGR